MAIMSSVSCTSTRSRSSPSWNMIVRNQPYSQAKLKHVSVALFLLLGTTSSFFQPPAPSLARSRRRNYAPWTMVLTPPQSASSSSSISSSNQSVDSKKQKGRNVKRKYKRKRIPETEKELKSMRKERQKEYERILESAKGDGPSIWSFESLFPEPLWDEEMIKRDLFEVKDRDSKLGAAKNTKDHGTKGGAPKLRSSRYGGNSMMRIWREPKQTFDHVARDPYQENCTEAASSTISSSAQFEEGEEEECKVEEVPSWRTLKVENATTGVVDRDLTRMVEDRVYGYRRTAKGTMYETSLMGDGAVKFRDGVRLGNPLKINADRLNYLAKKELQHGRIEEANELYEAAIQIDPRDGRAYLGLSRCAQRRRDFTLAREYLKAGIANSCAETNDLAPSDRGSNPFLLQALGNLEERMGHLSEAEILYKAAARSRPYHAAAWVALAQLRTRKLGQSASSGRICYQIAERELKKAGLPASSYVYTAWADMEYKKAGDVRRARELFKAALAADAKCSAAWLQLGVMEADKGNFKEAEEAFENVLKFDQRNSRVLQAYAIMETKRPDGKSRKAIGLFERALKVNPRDAGVYQAYGLYVAELGDVSAARDLLRRGTEVNKRHAPVWQAWGVLETRHGNASAARGVFQQGIWSCAQYSGNQSGGYHCARLWQAWGVLEAREKDYAAARRCFSRALDADSRNVAAVTAWAQMEAELGNLRDARAIYERCLPQFAAGSDAKIGLWRSYELMEQRFGDSGASQEVFQRAMREAITIKDESPSREEPTLSTPAQSETNDKEKEVEVIRWDGGGGEIWLNERAIEGKVPFQSMKKRRN